MSAEIALGTEISEDRKQAAIVAAGRGASGVVTVDLVWYSRPMDAVPKLQALSEKHDPVAVVLDPRSQSGTLVWRLTQAGIIPRQLSALEVAVAHGEFLDLVNEGGLEHLGQAPLTNAVRAAQQRRLAGAQAWERRVGADQSPLSAATFAVFGFLRWEELSTPGVF